MNGEFLADPRPERIAALDFPADGRDGKSGPLLTVGLKEITESIGGLKVTPHLAVVFAIDNAEVDIPLSWARDMAGKINEYCDFAEKRK